MKSIFQQPSVPPEPEHAPPIPPRIEGDDEYIISTTTAVTTRAVRPQVVPQDSEEYHDARSEVCLVSGCVCFGTK